MTSGVGTFTLSDGWKSQLKKARSHQNATVGLCLHRGLQDVYLCNCKNLQVIVRVLSSQRCTSTEDMMKTVLAAQSCGSLTSLAADGSYKC